MKTEVSQLSKTDAEDARSITGFAEVSIREAMREEKNPQLLMLSLKGLSTSVERFENSHPKPWELSIRSAIPYRTLEYERSDRDCRN